MHAEDVIIGQALQDNAIAIASGITADMFSQQKCARAWAAIQNRIKQGGKADMLTLFDAGLDSAWASGLTDYPVSNWRLYAAKVRKAHAIGELKKLGSILQNTNDSAEPQEVVNEILDRMQSIAHAESEDRPHTLKEIAGDYINLLQERYERKGELPGIKSGIGGLDTKLLGFEQSKYYVFGARPSQGKSALLITIFANMIKAGVKVGLLSLESSRNEIIDRLIAQTARVDGRKIKTGALHSSDFAGITESIDKALTDYAVIYDQPNANIGVLQMQAKYMQQRHGIQALLVDYLQIAKAHDRSRQHHEQIAEVSMTLKQLARELKIPVIAAAQLRRDAEGRRPGMDDISGSTQVERDADAIGLIYHEHIDGGDQRSSIIIAKNRDGVTGDVPVFLRREYAAFYDLEQ
jgi:replicative DNA helicase